MKTGKLIVSALLLGATAIGAFAQGPVTTKVIAHRGYWNTAGAAENSIRSLVKADSIGCYGSEFDVWMTKDGVLVVNHDPTINGVMIQDSPASEVLKQKLENGENVPTLEQYLQVGAKLKPRLVLELKSHDSRKQEKEAAKKVVEMVEKMGLQDRMDYIVFSKPAFTDLIKMAPKGTPVYYLNGDFIPQQVKFMKGKGIDYAFKVMQKHPEWVKKCHDLGLEVNVWTVNAPEDIQWCIDNGVDYITTNEPELVQKMLKK